MQLLQISITNAKYEITTKPARLEYNQELIPSADVGITNAEMNLTTKPAKLDIDTYQARKSLGLANIKDTAAAKAQKGSESLSDFTQETVSETWQMAEAGATGLTYGEIERRKMIAPPPSPLTVSLPSAPAEITYRPGSFQLDFNMGEINTDWKIHKTKFDYVAGSFNLDITQKPRVDIEYIGSPLYFPSGSNPGLK